MGELHELAQPRVGIDSHCKRGPRTVRDRCLRFRVQKTVKVPQVQYNDRIIMVPVRVPRQAPTIQSSRVAVVPVVLQRHEPTFLTVQETADRTENRRVASVSVHRQADWAISRQVSRVQLNTRLSGAPSCMSKSHRRLEVPEVVFRRRSCRWPSAAKWTHSSVDCRCFQEEPILGRVTLTVPLVRR